MAEPADTAQDKLNTLFAEFAARVSDKVAEIGTSVARVGTAKQSNYEEAVRISAGLAHKLAGSAGSFGYAELSKVASEMEVFCDNLVKSPTENVAATQQTLDDFVSRMRELAAGNQTTVKLT